MPTGYHTTSLSFPNLIDVSRNRLGVLTDDESVTNRVSCLLRINQTEVYNIPELGSSLEKYLFTYNNDNQRAIMKDFILRQLDAWEPQVDAAQSTVEDGLLFEEDGLESIKEELQHVKLTVKMKTMYGTTANLNLDSGGTYNE